MRRGELFKLVFCFSLAREALYARPRSEYRAKWGSDADISPVNQTMRCGAAVRELQLLAGLRSVNVR